MVGFSLPLMLYIVVAINVNEHGRKPDDALRCRCPLGKPDPLRWDMVKANRGHR